jgi:uncharacterized protein
MDLVRIERLAFESMADRREPRERERGWIFYHGRRTAKLALWLCGELKAGADREVLFAGALFHDIGKGSDNHNEAGAAAARKLLKNLCAPGQLDSICELILKHCQRTHSPDYSEAVMIVQDADVLDHFGPIEPWLAFYWSGKSGETFHDHLRFKAGKGSLFNRRKMRAALNYDVSKRMFDERLAFEEEFFTRFHRIYQEGL